MKKFGLFAAGVLFGTAGIKVLSSKDAKKVYTHTTAAVLRAKDSVMETVTTVRENAEDIRRRQGHQPAAGPTGGRRRDRGCFRGGISHEMQHSP